MPSSFRPARWSSRSFLMTGVAVGIVVAILRSVLSSTARAALDTPVAQWRFNNNGADDSGNNHPLTLSSDATYDSAVVFEGSHSLNPGSSGYASPGAYSFANQFTITSWVRIPSGTSNIQTVMANTSSGINYAGFKLFVNSYANRGQADHF